MTGVVIGGLIGYGMALGAFYAFRWADRMFVSRPDIVDHAPIRKAA